MRPVVRTRIHDDYVPNTKYSDKSAEIAFKLRVDFEDTVLETTTT